MFRLFKFFVPAVAAVLFFGGCRMVEPQGKITRVYSWGSIGSEEQAKRYAESGVTDIRVHNRKSFELAKKYGITPYYGCFTPTGPHAQVMTPDEEARHRYINGLDLPEKMSKKERKAIIEQRRFEKDHRYGGNRVDELDTINVKTLACFSSDKDLVLSRKKIDKILKRAIPGVKGIYLDYFGYANHRGCYCSECKERYQKWLTQNKLADTGSNKDKFYRDELITYYNAIVRYIKSRRPEFRIVAHFYPDFEADPWFGNRTEVDVCGHTVSWYFKWKEQDIARHTRNILAHARDYNRNGEAVPFIGVNVNPRSSLKSKTPAEIEIELRTIIAAGGRSLMVCNGSAMIEPGYFEVFRKYCGHRAGE
ncbi:MAG: hypothetical protein IJY46_04030 [Lentisphaeria bacterium]|nr:hypothetical protein [Lentisphaeria bacterium]